MKCEECSVGEMVPVESIPTQEVGRLLGLSAVVVIGAPGFRCSRCDATMMPGEVLEHVIPCLAAEMATVSDLGPHEAKFLRKTLDMTQSELAEKLNISRATIARWEDASGGGIKGADSYAIRALVGVHFRDINRSVADQIFRSLEKAPKGFRPPEYKVPYQCEPAPMSA